MILRACRELVGVVSTLTLLVVVLSDLATALPLLSLGLLLVAGWGLS